MSSDQSSSLSSSRAQQFDIKCAAVTAGGDILTASSDGRVQMFRFERRDRPVRAIGRAAHARPDRSSLARSNSQGSAAAAAAAAGENSPQQEQGCVVM